MLFQVRPFYGVPHQTNYDDTLISLSYMPHLYAVKFIPTH